MKRRRLLLGGMLALAGTQARAVTLVRYPRSEPQGQGEQPEHYAVRLLRMALAWPCTIRARSTSSSKKTIRHWRPQSSTGWSA